MPRSWISLLLVCLVIAAALLSRSDSRGDDPTDTLKKAEPVTNSRIETPPKAAATQTLQATAETAVQRALAEPADFNFVDTPLKDAASFVAGRYKINVLLDTKALNGAGVTPDSTVTERIKGVTLQSALHFLLSQKGLASVTLPENNLLFTTPEVAKNNLTTRVYGVRDFITSDGWRIDEFAQPTDDSIDCIIEVITCTVAPMSWDSKGGRGSVSYINGAIVVAQTEEVHRQIAALLTDLREVRQAQLKDRGQGSATVKSQTAESSQRIRKALATPLDFDFVDTPIKDVVGALQRKLEIPIRLDTKALTDAGIVPDTTITLAMKQTAAQRGLRQLLAEKNLTFVIEDEAVVVTTVDRAKESIYPVAYAVGDLCGFTDSASVGRPDYDSLIETITSTIAPSSWDSNGAAGTVMPLPVANAIVCVQTDVVQQQIADLLAQLRANGFLRAPPPVPRQHSAVVRIYFFPSPASNAPRDEQAPRELIDLIRQLIEPKSWSDGSASIGPAPGGIVVRQTPEVQDRIERFLSVFGVVVYPPPQVRSYGNLKGGSSLTGPLPAKAK
jgi:hypothetical protein